MEQTNEDGNELDLAPAFMLVPPVYSMQARQLLAPVTPNETAKVNPYVGAVTPIVDARLGRNASKAWFLLSSPDECETVQVAFLEGSEGVEIFTRDGFDVDGLEIKARMDFGVGFLDHRGAAKNPG